jgi:hypothetical protein
VRLDALPKNPDRQKDVAELIRAQLASASLTDLAVYRLVNDEPGETVLVATEAGIYVGSLSAQAAHGGDIALSGDLIAWSEVRGAHLNWSGYPGSGDGWIVSLDVDVPEIRERLPTPANQPALIAFALECVNRQKGAK